MTQTWFWDQSVRKSFFVKLQEMLTFCTKFPSTGYWKAHYTKNYPFNVGWLSGPAANSKYAGVAWVLMGRPRIEKHCTAITSISLQWRHCQNVCIIRRCSLHLQSLVLNVHLCAAGTFITFVPYFYLIEGSVQVKNLNSFVIWSSPCQRVRWRFFCGGMSVGSCNLWGFVYFHLSAH